MIKNKDIIHGICKDLSFEGKGVLSFGKDIIFVDGLFPGEEADVEILYKKAGVYFGKVKKLYSLSKDRIDPKCKICSACGGCQFQQYAYKAQLVYKQNKVKNALYRYLKKEIEVMPTIGMANEYHYRNKIQVPLGYDKKHQLVSGFYRAGTHEIIPMDECFIEDQKAKEIIHNIKLLIKEFHYDAYDEDTGKGIFRHILIRTSKHYEQIMVTLVTCLDEFKGKNNFVKELVKACPSVTSIVQNINPRKTNVILGEKERILFGPKTIKDSILGVDFLISSKSFFQVNPTQVETLYSKAIELANLKATDNVFDAYCGIGTIGLIASKKVNSVTGVEIIKEAIKDANINKRINNINNATFICGDAGEEMGKIMANNTLFDVIFVDPPRKGLSEKFIKTLLSIKPKTIIYISCEPETLARDLALLSSAYNIKVVQPVDMFPMTHHIETVASLIIKGK